VVELGSGRRRRCRHGRRRAGSGDLGGEHGGGEFDVNGVFFSAAVICEEKEKDLQPSRVSWTMKTCNELLMYF
jgi:hypothetical protein